MLPTSSEPIMGNVKGQEEREAFLSVSRLKVRKEIKENLSWLDDNQVCTLAPFSKNHGTILLFGHNRTNVFHFLYQLDIGDELRLEYNGKIEIYHVKEIKIIPVSEKKYLMVTSTKEIRMFTCTRNSNTRLMVIAK